MAILDDIVAATRATKTAKGWQGHCPAHRDRSPSLSIADGDVGVVLYCHAGCGIDEICLALGVRPTDLFHEDKVFLRAGAGFEGRRETLRHKLALFSSSEMRHEIERRAGRDDVCPRCSSHPGNRVWGTWHHGFFGCIRCGVTLELKQYEPAIEEWHHAHR